MQKFWKLSQSKSNKLIFIKDQCIYKGNPKQEELQKLNEHTTNLDFLKNLFSIPYAYIKQIENQKGKDYIKIFYGSGSEDELVIKDSNIKKEVFDFLRQDMSKFKYSSGLPSALKYAKAQFFALLFTTLLFIASLYFAVKIENGTEYEIMGRGILTLIIAIANLGVIKVVLGYIIIVGIVCLALVNRLKSRSETEFLRR
ncbi:hypothetical protein [Winogradskyella sp.]|uniref:hypothetical protein n=1 Tax=Winogradskyella sp. TaxID=1883156 RepID=UPI002631DAD3|nr:hypothetical protein [Winogradskyella sp.]